MTEWQPIETAPKGEPVLISWGDGWETPGDDPLERDKVPTPVVAYYHPRWHKWTEWESADFILPIGPKYWMELPPTMGVGEILLSTTTSNGFEDHPALQ